MQAFAPARRTQTLLLLGARGGSAAAAFGMPGRARRAAAGAGLSAAGSAAGGAVGACRRRPGFGRGGRASLGVVYAGSLGLGPFGTRRSPCFRRRPPGPTAQRSSARCCWCTCCRATASASRSAGCWRWAVPAWAWANGAGARRGPHLAAMEAAERRRLELAVDLAVAGARRRPAGLQQSWTAAQRRAGARQREMRVPAEDGWRWLDTQLLVVERDHHGQASRLMATLADAASGTTRRSASACRPACSSTCTKAC